MKASELIKALQEAIEEHGDLDMYITDNEYGDYPADGVGKVNEYLYLW